MDSNSVPSGFGLQTMNEMLGKPPLSVVLGFQADIDSSILIQSDPITLFHLIVLNSSTALNVSKRDFNP